MFYPTGILAGDGDGERRAAAVMEDTDLHRAAQKGGGAALSNRNPNSNPHFNPSPNANPNPNPHPNPSPNSP